VERAISTILVPLTVYERQYNTLAYCSHRTCLMRRGPQGTRLRRVRVKQRANGFKSLSGRSWNGARGHYTRIGDSRASPLILTPRSYLLFRVPCKLRRERGEIDRLYRFRAFGLADSEHPR
jgi:hypothetical protein